MSAVDKYLEKLPFLVCKNCGCVEFTVSRFRLKLHHCDGDTVINQLECHYCGEPVTLLP